MNKKQLFLIGLSSLILSACTLKPNTTPVVPSQPEITPATPVTEDPSMREDAKTYTLTEQNSSGQTGTLTLTEATPGQTTAVLALTGGNFTEPQPAHIHEGTCPNPDAVQFPLNDVVDGQSTTVLNMSIKDMLATFPNLAVNVHKSKAESKVYTACGDLK
jgi:hypothetical protein